MKTLLNIIIAVLLVLTGSGLTLIVELVAIWRHLKGAKKDGEE